MLEFLKKFFGKKHISEETLDHSSKGTYTTNNRLKSGGHGQEAIDYMANQGIEYNVVTTFPNGVRLGNVPRHAKSRYRSGTKQSWFPENWNRKTIKKAGRAVAKGKVFPDGKYKKGVHKHVNVGIIRKNGKIVTVFPMYEQENKLVKRRNGKWTKNI